MRGGEGFNLRQEQFQDVYKRQVYGSATSEQWGEASRKADFHDLKGDLESLAAASGAVLEYRPSTRAFGHPGRSADVFRCGQCIGWICLLYTSRCV